MTRHDIKTLWFIFNLVKCVVYPHLTLGIIHNIARFEGLVVKELQGGSSVYWMEFSQRTFSLLHANRGQNYTIPEPSLQRCAYPVWISPNPSPRTSNICIMRMRPGSGSQGKVWLSLFVFSSPEQILFKRPAAATLHLRRSAAAAAAAVSKRHKGS